MFSRFSPFLSFLRLLSFFLAVSFSCSLLWAANEPDDDLEETEEESYGPLQIKSQTRLCSADYYIKGGIEKDREEDRKRKNIGIGENISFLLIGKPKEISRILPGVSKETDSSRQILSHSKVNKRSL